MLVPVVLWLWFRLFVSVCAQSPCMEYCLFSDAFNDTLRKPPACICQSFCSSHTQCMQQPYEACDTLRTWTCKPCWDLPNCPFPYQTHRSALLSYLEGIPNRTTLQSIVFHNAIYNHTQPCSTTQLTPRSMGCPCDQGMWQCANGTTCTDTRSPDLGWRCMPCPKGSLCTTRNPTNCPYGHYCPNGTTQVPCPIGAFCPINSYEPIPCSPTTQFIPYTPPQTPPIVKLFTEPVHGTTCPQGSTTPTKQCPRGFYCPNSTTVIPCPHGYYCKPQSTYPIKCPPLTPCPPQSSHASFSYILIIFVIGVALVCVGPYVYAYIMHKLNQRKRISLNIVPRISSALYEVQVGDIRDEPDTKEEQDLSHVFTAWPIAPSAPTKTFEFHHVGVTSNNHVWLHPTTGKFIPDDINAVMGSSGCGKSTLMEVLRGRMYAGNVTGTVHLTIGPDQTYNVDLEMSSKSLKEYRSNFLFVPQDDIVYGELTVEENITMAGRLKTSGLTQANVHEIIEHIGLMHIKEKVVGTALQRGISGGQRKRVSIAMELVAKRPILVLDEPTSGLDSTGSLDVLSTIKRMSTTHGITTICIVHQPRFNSFMLFEHLLLLSKNGTLFMGSPTMAITYFQYALHANLSPDDNPADAIMDLAHAHHAPLAKRWQTDGSAWVRKASALYPNLHHMTPEYTTTLHGFLTSYNGDIFQPAHMLQAFHALGVSSFSHKDAIALSKYTPSSLGRLIRVILTQTPSTKLLCRNIVARCTVFQHGIPSLQERLFAPHPDMFSSTRTFLLVRKFCRLLMRSLDHHAPHKENDEPLHHKLILFVMSINGRFSKQQPTPPARPQDPLRPNRFVQFTTMCHTKVIAWFRSLWLVHVILCVGGGIIIGLLQGSDWSPLEFPGKISMAITCLAILSCIKHVDTFTSDALITRRHIYNNASITSYFLAYNACDLLWVTLMPLMFLVPYYYLVFPISPFKVIYGFMWLCCFWVSGFTYVITQIPYLNEPVWSNLICVFTVVIMGVFFNGLMLQNAQQPFLVFLHGVSYNKWATEALTVQELSLSEPTLANLAYAYIRRLAFCSKGVPQGLEPFTLKVVKALVATVPTLPEACGYVARKNSLILWAEGMGFRILAVMIFLIRYYSIELKRALKPT